MEQKSTVATQYCARKKHSQYRKQHIILKATKISKMRENI